MNESENAVCRRWFSGHSRPVGWRGIVLALACLLVTTPGATANEPVLSASEIDYSPFCVVDADGRATGFSVELMRSALLAMGRDVTFRTGPWSDVRGWLETGEVQALPLVGRTPERELLFDFTVPYMSLHGAIVVRKDTTGIQTMEDLRGRRVAVMKGDNAEEFLRREDRGVSIHTTATFTDALRELSEGRHDAVVIQRLVALRLLQEIDFTNLWIINRPIDGFRQDFCFAVREGDRDTLALLNEGLALVVADGTHRYLHAKWFAALELPSNRRIVVGGDHDYPPFEYLDANGQPTGYNVDLTRAIAREMGLDVEIRLGPWAEVREALARGEIDVIQGMFYSPERDLTFDFTPPYAMNHCVAVTRGEDGPPPATVEELAGRHIVVQRGDIMHDFALRRGLEKRLSALETQKEALRRLSSGEYDCALVSRLLALYTIRKHGWTNLAVGRAPLFSPEYGYAVLNDHKALLAQFTEGLRVIEETGGFRSIQQKWMSVYEESSPDIAEILGYVAVVVIPLLLVLSGSFLWSWSMRKRVAVRTAELAAMSSRHQAILAAVPDIVMETDVRKVYTWANPAGIEFFGEDVIGREAAEYFIGEQDTYARVQPMFDGDETVLYIESWQRRRDGRERLLVWWSRVLKDKSGKVCGALSTARDITESRKADETLRQSEERFRIAFDSDAIGRVLTGVDERLMRVNRRFCEMLGYDAGELTSLFSPDITYPEDLVLNRECTHRLLAGEDSFQHFEKRYIRKDGGVLWADVNVTLIRDERGEPIHFLAGIQDIDARKRMEAEREHANFIFSRLLDVARELTGVLDFTDVFRILRRAARALTGADGAAIVVREGEMCHYVDEDAIEPLWKGQRFSMSQCISGWVMRNGRTVAIRDISVDPRISLEPYRHTFVKSLAMTPIRSENPVGAIGVYWAGHHEATMSEQSLLAALGDMASSVWETLRAHEALRSSEETLGTMFRQMQDGVLVVELERRKFVISNPAICRNTGYTHEEILSFGLTDIHPAESLIHVVKQFERMVKGEITLASDIPVKRKDGTLFFADISATSLELRGQPHLLGIFRDITEQKREKEEREKMRVQLLQAQKMESVGRLAGGVAHDYNNMLGVILGYTELALERVGVGDPLHADLREILKAGRRSADITRQLLAFARKQTVSPKILDLNETVEGMLKMLRRLIGENIDLLWKPAKTIWSVKMDPSQLDQILANLCVNARDAIAGVGKLTIETGNITFNEEYCADHAGFFPGEFVLLAVSDDGCGMGKETIGNIFEPFYTTKGVNQGTGLGLSTVYGIIKQNGGFINVYSEPGKGTTFRIYLPRHAGAPEGRSTDREAEIPAGCGETVLLVEDEPSIMQMARMMLERMGYRVLAANTPAQALNLAGEYAGQIQLLITDVIMPERNGRDLARQLHTLHPDIKTLFMSGYTANVIAHHGVLDEGVYFIQKPFSRKELSVKIREALGGK